MKKTTRTKYAFIERNCIIFKKKVTKLQNKNSYHQLILKNNKPFEFIYFV